MQKAVDLLVGTHDFGGFTDKKDEKSMVRTIYRIEILEDTEKIRLVFHGDGFLYHTVRILTGTLLEIGDGEKEPEVIRQIFQSKNRAEAGFLAPASGLCLKEVLY